MNLDVWCCPVCLSPLREEAGALRCQGEGRAFGARGGLSILVRPQEEGQVQEAEDFARVWRCGDWAPPPGRLRELPYVGGPVWSQKARSLEALLGLMGPAAGRTVADVGAGTGWLGHRLSIAGFRCFATDISVDLEVGLGAAPAFDGSGASVERAIATLDRWPFQTGSIDLAICNASLHYPVDARPAIKEAARVVPAGGAFVVMNSPVHEDPASARRSSADFRARLGGREAGGDVLEGRRHLVAAQLEDILRDQFANVRRVDPNYGAWFALSRRAKGMVLRVEMAAFPIYICTKA